MSLKQSEMRAGWNVDRGWIKWDYMEGVKLPEFTTTGSLPLDDGQTLPSPPVIIVTSEIYAS